MNRILVKSITIALLLALFSACTAIYEDGEELAKSVRKYVTEITVDELNAKLESGEEFLLIDVRQAAEYDGGAIPGAINIPRGNLEFQIRNDEFWEEEFLYTPENDEEIIVYCKLGYRGILSAYALKQMGFTNVKNLQGGITAWDPNMEQNAPKAVSSGGCGG